jgi:hypothetical protein
MQRVVSGIALTLLCLIGLVQLTTNIGRIKGKMNLVQMKYKTSAATQDIVSGTGTIIFLGFEGGFWGIVGDDGKHYDPVNLGQFQVNGSRVWFEAEVLHDAVSFHMWGKMVSIIHIENLGLKSDVWSVCKAFGSTRGQPRFDTNCDFDGNGKIDIKDVAIAVKQFARTVM